MDDMIQKKHITQPTVIQTAEKSVYIENKPGSTVNVTINSPTPMKLDPTLTASNNTCMSIVQSLSHEYYSLIVFIDPNHIMDENVAWAGVARSPFRKGAVLPDILQAQKNKSSYHLKTALKNIPAIICYENTEFNGQTDPKQKATLAYINDIRQDEKEILIYYTPICKFPQQLLNDNRTIFEIYRYGGLCSLNESGWSIRNINIFDALEEVGVSI